MVLRPASLNIWRLKQDGDAFELEWNPVDDLRIPIGRVTSTREASAIARRHLRDPTVRFDRHPWLDEPRGIWSEAQALTSQSAKTLLLAPAKAKSDKEHEGRRNRWQEQDPVIADALDHLTWKEIATMPGAIDSQRTLLARLKGNRLSLWDRTQQRVGCPHCINHGTDTKNTVHVFWECPKAQLVWNNLLTHWIHLWSHDAKPTLDASKVDIFSLRLTAIPDLLWTHPEMHRLPLPSPDAVIATHAAVCAAWRQHVLVSRQIIWNWRTSADHPDQIWNTEHIRGLLHTRLMASLGDLTAHSAATPHTAAALDILRHPQWRQDESLPDLTSVPGDTRYLLFFDGGSRGNPGPGGSGAVIARITDEATHATVVYTAATSHAARTTTNNQAEYRGLVTGLTAATQFQWTPLEVVGDSMLIIQQMKRYKAPQNRRLQRSYAVARRLADILGVRTWKHHPRAANRMADAAANLAMDEERSSQVLHPTHRPEHKQIAALLSSDIAHYRIGLQS